MATLADQALGVWQTLATLVLVWVLVQVYQLGCDWEAAISDVDVYTIQDPKFWGPVTMLVPNNCDWLQSKAPAGLDKNVSLLTTFDTEVQTNLLGHPIMSTQDVVNFVTVQKCGVTIEALNVTSWQYYFAAMSTAGSEFDIAGLHQSRMLLFLFFGFCALLGQCAGNYMVMMQLKAVESGMPDMGASGDMNRKFQQFTSQCSLITLFIAIWEGDHYIMNYYPGNAYIYLFAMMPLLAGSQVMAAASGNQGMVMCCSVVAACCGCWLFWVVIIPLATGWALYNLQFLYLFLMGRFQHNVDPTVQQHADQLIHIILGVNVLDLVLSTAMSCGASASAREPPIAEDMTGYLSLDAEAANPVE